MPSHDVEHLAGLPVAAVLEQLFEQRTVGIAILDRDLRYVRVSPTLAEMNGLTVDEHIGRTLPEVLGEEAWSVAGPLLEGVLRGTGIHDAEVATRGRAFRVSYLPLRAADSAVVGVVGLVTEVTAGRRAEAELRISQERLQFALEGTQTGTFQFHIAENRVVWSDNLGPLWGRERGWSPPDYETYLATLHPDDRPVLIDLVTAAVQHGRGYETEHRVCWPDGQVRWVTSRVHVMCGDDGTPELLVGFTSDVTDRRRRELASEYLARASLALAESLDVRHTLRRVVDLAVPHLGDWCALHLAGRDGAIERIAVAHADPERAALIEALQTEYPPEPDAPIGVPAVIRSGRSELYPEITDDVLELAAQDARHLELMRDLKLRSGMVVALAARGRTFGAITFVTSSGEYTTDELELAEELGRRAGLAIDNARLHDAEQAANRRLRELQAVTDVALSHLELDQLLPELLERVRGALHADFSAALMANEERTALQVEAAVGVEIGANVLVPWGKGVAGRIAASGQPLVLDDVPAVNPISPHLRQAASLVGVPLRVRGEVIGVLHAATRTPRRFGADDVELLELVADRVARAIAQARLYAQARSTSDTLQRSLLPATLPRVPGLEVAVRYVAGQKGSEVGGDWYDVLARRDGRCMVTVGDVMGRGVTAAAQMGKLRAALRAYAHESGGPGEAVMRLDSLVDATGEVAFATLALLMLDPATGAGTLCLAGHPPPVVRRAGGGAEVLQLRPGVPIGAPPGDRPDHAVTLEHGDVVLLYTDGLVERRDVDVRTRIDALARAVAEGPEAPEALVDHCIARLAGGGDSEDDLALLALRRTSPRA